MDELQLRIDGVRYGGWQEVRVTRSVEAIADTFDLKVTERWPGQAERRPIEAGSACELVYGDQRVMTGYVDDVTPNYDASSHVLTVAGRSKLGDAVDCSITGNLGFKQRTLTQIAREVLQPFGIGVEAETDVGDPLDENASRTETVFSFLQPLARKRGVLLVSNTDGDLVITRAGRERAEGAIELGENIIKASGQHSFRDRFAEIIVLGQPSMTKYSPGDKPPVATANDSGVNRHRPRAMRVDGPATLSDCRDRAAWERNTRYGRSQGTVYTVHGWRQTQGGPLWQPNQRVPVVDAYQEIDRDLLIASVQYVLDGDGARTELRVLPKEAYEIEPLLADSAPPTVPLAIS